MNGLVVRNQCHLNQSFNHELGSPFHIGMFRQSISTDNTTQATQFGLIDARSHSNWNLVYVLEEAIPFCQVFQTRHCMHLKLLFQDACILVLSPWCRLPYAFLSIHMLLIMYIAWSLFLSSISCLWLARLFCSYKFVGRALNFFARAVSLYTYIKFSYSQGKWLMWVDILFDSECLKK